MNEEEVKNADLLPVVKSGGEKQGLDDAQFFKKYGYCWDYAVVFPVQKDGSIDRNTKDAIAAIQASGLEVYCYYSVQRDKMFYCKIRAPLERLKKAADSEDKMFKLDQTELKRIIEEDPEAPLKLTHDEKRFGRYEHYEFIHARYAEEEAWLYEKAPGLAHPFSAVARLQLIEAILSRRHEVGGAELRLRRMVRDGDALAGFPLHDPARLKKLEGQWINWRQLPHQQPFQAIKAYFGTKIAMYYSFLGHFTLWCAAPAAAGLLVQAALLARGNGGGGGGGGGGDTLLNALYAFLVMLWAICWLEAWKRNEARNAMEWGTAGLEEELADRPEFFGELVTSPVHGGDEVFYPRAHRLRRQMASSVAIVVFCTAAVGGALLAICSLRYFLESVEGYAWGSTAAAAANALQISLMNWLYSGLAVWLNDKENHKNDVLYEDSLVGKLFLFQFLNTFSSFFYIAFAPQIWESVTIAGCERNCVNLLAENLVVIFLVQLVVNNAAEYIHLVISTALNKAIAKGRTGMNTELTFCEKQYCLAGYGDLREGVDDYAELAMQFGFLTLFVAAFPLAPALGFIVNWVEIKADAWILLNFKRRPSPAMAEDIGAWQTVFRLIAVIAIVTNAALVSFVMDGLFGEYSLQFQVWAFGLVQCFAFLVQIAIAQFIPDVPEEVTLQLQRQDFLAGRAVRNVAQAVARAGGDGGAGLLTSSQHALIAKQEAREYRIRGPSPAAAARGQSGSPGPGDGGGGGRTSAPGSRPPSAVIATEEEALRRRAALSSKAKSWVVHKSPSPKATGYHSSHQKFDAV